MSNEVKTETTSLYEQLVGTYTEVDGIFYPDVTLDDEIAEQHDFCGKYGDMWKKHMHAIYAEINNLGKKQIKRDR